MPKPVRRGSLFVVESLEPRYLLSFAAPVSYNYGTQNAPYVPNAAPVSVASGDFNGDGKLDLVTAHAVDNSFYLLLNNGNGTFQPAVKNATSEILQGGVFVADFNGDGKLDLFLPAGGTGGNNFTTHAVIVPGNGNGTFGTAIASSSFGASRGWAVGEFNGDGTLDLVATNPVAGTVSVLLGNGNGTFQAALVSAQLFQYSRWVTAGDFNADGKTDLAIADGIGQGAQTGTAELTILIGNGNGTFGLGGHYPSPEVGNEDDTVNPEDVVAADVNQDGKLDVIVSDYSYNINIFLGNGNGTFQAAKGIEPGEYPRSVVVTDVNNDGKKDLVVTNVGVNVGGAEFNDNGPEPGSVAVLLGNGDGTFQTPVQYTPFDYPGWTAVGDFNGDGWIDLAVTRVLDGHSVNVMLNQPPANNPPSGGGNTGGGSTNPPAPAPAAATLRMYRAYNPNASYHFFTTSLVEFNNAVAHGYRDESTNQPGFAVLAGPASGATTIHRMYNPNNGRHYYTLSDFERDVLVTRGWRYEKDEGYMYSAVASGTVEVFRMYNRLSGAHLFTSETYQKDSILSQLGFAWSLQTSLGYAFAVSASGVVQQSAVSAPSTAAALKADLQVPVRLSAEVTEERVESENRPQSLALISLGDAGATKLHPIESPNIQPPVPTNDRPRDDDFQTLLSSSELVMPAKLLDGVFMNIDDCEL